MLNYDLNLLKIFYEVAIEKNITKASEHLFISQPAVSQSIKKLEAQFGGKLLNRSNKGIELTEEGKVLFFYVESALSSISKGEVEFKNFKGLKSGTLKIGISTTLTKLFLLNPLKKFHHDFPNIKIEIVNNLTSVLIEELNRGNIDFAIVGDNTNDKNKVIKKLDYCFVYNKNFFNFEKPVSLIDIKNYPFILQNKKSASRQNFDSFLDSMKLQIFPYMEVVSQELAYIFSICGLGIGLVLKDYLQYEKNDELKILETKEKLPSIDIKLITSPKENPSFASQKFFEYLK